MIARIIYSVVHKAPYPITGQRASEIAASVEEQIAAGRLPEGARLPTVRGLAERLEVSPATVAAAYRSLGGRGLVAGHGKAGTIVSRRRSRSARPAETVLPSGVIDLASGDPDPDLLPDLRPALAAVAADLDADAGRSRPYGEPGTLPELASVLADWIRAEGGPRPAPGGVLVVGGVLDGVERALVSQVRPGAAVAVEDPAYSGVLDLLDTLGLVAVPIPVDPAGMLPDPLAASLAGPPASRPAAVLLTLRAQNPTGAAVTAQRADELARVLDEHPDVLLIEDDHLGAVAGAPLHSVAARAVTTRWAYVHGLAKTLGPDLRLAGLVADQVITARVQTRLRAGPGWISWLLQRLALHLLTDPDHGGRVVQAAAAYARRREALAAELERYGLRTTSGTGFNLWVPVAHEAATAQAALAAGIAVRPGEAYRIDSPPAVRITASRLEPEYAPAVAAALAGPLGAGSTRAPAGHRP